eukprot:COSAG01_NODE_1490_length_10131_cov_15.364135_2_plen_39_part_00
MVREPGNQNKNSQEISCSCQSYSKADSTDCINNMNNTQ